ncbi:hypothetical protein KIPB_004860, partial [Kipferlia bialata]|eukprot:g4860.t1
MYPPRYSLCLALFSLQLQVSYEATGIACAFTLEDEGWYRLCCSLGDISHSQTIRCHTIAWRPHAPVLDVHSLSLLDREAERERVRESERLGVLSPHPSPSMAGRVGAHSPLSLTRPSPLPLRDLQFSSVYDTDTNRWSDSQGYLDITLRRGRRGYSLIVLDCPAAPTEPLSPSSLCLSPSRTLPPSSPSPSISMAHARGAGKREKGLSRQCEAEGESGCERERQRVRVRVLVGLRLVTRDRDRLVGNAPVVQCGVEVLKGDIVHVYVNMDEGLLYVLVTSADKETGPSDKGTAKGKGRDRLDTRNGSAHVTVEKHKLGVKKYA